MVTFKVATGAGIDFSPCTLPRCGDQSLETAPDLGEDGAIPVSESSEGRWTPLERGVQYSSFLEAIIAPAITG